MSHDDIVLISENRNDVQNLVSELLNVSQKAGLHVNTEKTKYMINRDTREICISNMEKENVNEFIYLGHIMSFTDNMDMEL